jgi:hypothetical protein
MHDAIGEAWGMENIGRLKLLSPLAMTPRFFD